MDRLNQRQGFLFSAIVHMLILTVLWSRPPGGVAFVPEKPTKADPELMSQRIFLPPPAMLRQILPSAPPRPPASKPAPRLPEAKDRISIGPPSDQRAKGPLVLRREDDLTAVPKGRPDAGASPEPSAATRPPAPSAPVREPLAAEGRPGLRLPPGLAGRAPAGDEGAVPRPGPSAPSIASSLRNIERRMSADGARGVPTGTGQQMGPLFFDPEGADFTLWVNHFKNEVYRNWIVPQPALLGIRGHVDLEFSVERDGTLTNLRMLKSSGTSALDRAAQNALVGSRLLPLPADYGPPRVQMQVTFFYNEGPQGS